jgi:glycosyltransferase involved in cell wall biosynthesis
MKIAILTFGDPGNKKGAFNATHQRIKHLICRGINVDVFIIRYYENRFIQLLRKKEYKKEVRDDFFVYDSVKYNNLWIPFALSDYVQWQKLNQLGSVFIKFAKKWSKLFAGYDLISAHSLEPAIIATHVKRQFGVPFAITWHGSDIHSMPKMNTSIKAMVLKACRDASLVFFVSKQLQIDAAGLGADITNSAILYNAIDTEQFKPISRDEKEHLKTVNKIDGSYNISFIGGLTAVKNIQVLPEIFRIIADSVENAKFYFVGDGNLKVIMMEKCREFGLNAVFMGDRLQEEMPGLINCFDLIVLPSLNEGLPLIVLESIACQTPIITSKVGGIPEILSDEYTVTHGPGFVERYASLAIKILTSAIEKKVELSSVFNWEHTANKEAAMYYKVLNKIDDIAGKRSFD